MLVGSALCCVASCSLPPLATWHSAPRGSDPSVEVGTASWYGPGFHGNRTSSGEVYNQNELTAAHPTLPLGSRVMVTNIENGRSVELRINDRGPFVEGRIVDLSYAAAKALRLVGPGTAPVRIERLEVNDGPLPYVEYAAQAGAFQDSDRAMALREELAAEFREVYMSPLRTPTSLFYRVRVGPFTERHAAATQARRLSRRGLPAIVVEEVRP